MGINVRIETERGVAKEELLDPSGYLVPFLVMVGSAETSCVRFIDPYGQAVFNALQIPVLEGEIAACLPSMEVRRLRARGEQDLAEATRVQWSPAVIESLGEAVWSPARDPDVLGAVRSHVEQVLALIARARSAGVHTYVRFVGD